MVVKARDNSNNKIYALKKVRMDLDTEGFPLTSIREIKLLKNINHPNIVKLFSVVSGNNKDRLELEYINLYIIIYLFIFLFYIFVQRFFSYGIL